MIKVAFVKSHGFHFGGTEILLQRYAAYLDKTKFEVHYYSGPSSIHSQVDFLKLNGVSVHMIGSTFLELDADIIHCVAGETLRLYKSPHAKIVESVTLVCNEKTRIPDWSIHMSEWQRRQWYWHGYGDWNKSSTIASPVGEPLTSENYRAQLGIEKDAIVTGLIQRVDDAIYSSWPLDAWHKCQAKGRYFLVMGGSLKYKAQALGMKNVIFIPSAGDLEVCKFYNTLDFLTHGRKDGETYGTVIADALTHGLPILSHKGQANGHKETIGKAGMFCSYFKDYAWCMEELFESPQKRVYFSKFARIQAEQYSIDHCMTRLQSIYENLFYRNLMIVDPPPIIDSAKKMGYKLFSLTSGNTKSLNSLLQEDGVRGSL